MNSFGVNDASASNGLFLERLDAFTEKTLADIRAFSERENIPYDQVRRHVAERHSQYLFGGSTGSSARHQSIRNVLLSTSQILESLQASAGIQSFLLAVNPNDAEDEGFLGGSSLGREFWRSLRGGGMAGAKALKALALSGSANPHLPPIVAPPDAASPTRQKETAHSLKSDVYARTRALLRATSGVRNAEMKWTNHGNLSVYGVRLEGWPADIPMQNPSTLSTSQNKELRDALSRGSLRFCRLDSDRPTSSITTSATHGSTTDANDFSWAISEELMPSQLLPGIEEKRPLDSSYVPRDNCRSASGGATNLITTLMDESESSSLDTEISHKRRRIGEFDNG
ncbi:hypothetical protein BC834DRAFT_882965 [Gloeopeniophorella convolvens]|nr:hypothetical protein BC834DRAFT_882965 [Gloeopeniophorella convolvens]